MHLSQLWADKTGTLPKQIEHHKTYTEFSFNFLHPKELDMCFTHKKYLGEISV